MKYSFVFAATLAFLAAAPFASHGEDAAPNPPALDCRTISECKDLLKCRAQGGVVLDSPEAPYKGVVLVSPEKPHNPVKVFCADELKRFDCQILSHIENYILYSYGECENNSYMYKESFSRPVCSGLKGEAFVEFNMNAYDTIPLEVKQSFFRLIKRTEYEKGCLPPNFTPRD